VAMIVTSDQSGKSLPNSQPMALQSLPDFGSSLTEKTSSFVRYKGPGIGGTAGLEPVAITKALALRCLPLTLRCAGLQIHHCQKSPRHPMIQTFLLSRAVGVEMTP